MSEGPGSERDDYPRSCFLGTAAVGFAAAQLGTFADSKAQSSDARAVGQTSVRPRAQAPLGPLKQVGVLPSTGVAAYVFIVG